MEEASAGDTDSAHSARDLSKLSTEQLLDLAAETSRRIASLAARFVRLTAELDRREGWRTEGATSLEAWIVERCGASVPTARAYAHVGERLFDLPHLAAELAEGFISFDKVRAVVDSATPETDREFADQAAGCSVRQLAELARAKQGFQAGVGRDQHDARSLRFNETCRTVTAQLPPESFAEVRSSLEARARQIPSDGDTGWDRRLADALVSLVRTTNDNTRVGGAPYLVVAHVPLAALVDHPDDGDFSELAGGLERGGFISTETLRRLACNTSLVIAVDDDVGHTMYEGRERRLPSAAQRREIMRRDRHCRFPGCTNAIFINPHHIVPWVPGGRTDLDNLAVLCEHHHHMVHSKHWTMSGNANEELTFVGPSGRIMTSLPSPLWTTVSDPRRFPGARVGPA
jgi:hypothetical protein